SSIISTLLLLIIGFGFFTLVTFQVKGFLDNWDNLLKAIGPVVESFNNFILKHAAFEMEPLETQHISPKLPDLSEGEIEEQPPFSFVNYAFGFALDFLLTFVYIFFLLNYRRKFREF